MTKRARARIAVFDRVDKVRRRFHMAKNVSRNVSQRSVKKSDFAESHYFSFPDNPRNFPHKVLRMKLSA